MRKGNLVLIRGLPGTNKGEKAKEKFPNHLHLETSMYFDFDGVYLFDQSKLAMAHDWCLNKTIDAINKGQDVVVTNTFIKKWEMSKYLKIGTLVDIYVTDMNKVVKDTVDDNVLARMRKNYEPHHSESTID